MLALPPGFSYQIVAESGVTTMADGNGTPADPDANGVFRSGTGSTIVNNHEIGGTEASGVPPLPGLTYDPGARGGTTNIEVDADGNRLREYVSLAGTHNNCAGGDHPVGHLADLRGDRGTRRAARCRRTTATSSRSTRTSQEANLGKSPVPLKFLGRFAHEAVAVDPTTHAIYETEDAGGPNGLLLPLDPADGLPAAARARCASSRSATAATPPGGCRR